MNLMNNELRNIGIGVKSLNDYERSIALIVRRTFGISNMNQVDTYAAEVESFVNDILSVIRERKVNNGIYQS